MDGVLDRLRIEIVGSGDLRADGLAANRVGVTVTGSGDAVVRAVEQLDASVTGSGDVIYYGNPHQVQNWSPALVTSASAKLEKTCKELGGLPGQPLFYPALGFRFRASAFLIPSICPELGSGNPSNSRLALTFNAWLIRAKVVTGHGNLPFSMLSGLPVDLNQFGKAFLGHICPAASRFHVRADNPKHLAVCHLYFKPCPLAA